MKRTAVLSALVLLPVSLLSAAELQSAGELISTIEAARQKPEEAENAGAEFQAKLEAFTATASSLAPEAAARGWLELYMAWREQKPSHHASYQSHENSGFAVLLKSLPPPPAWEALRAEIAKAPLKDTLLDQLLALLAATLNADPAGQMQAFRALAKMSGNDSAGSPTVTALRDVMGNMADKLAGATAFQLAQPLAKLLDDPAQIRELLEVQIKTASIIDEGSLPSVNFPGLAALGGEEKAIPLIKSALAVGITPETENPKLRALIRKIVLANPDSLKTPPWRLIDGIDEQNMQLYKLLAKKFPKTQETQYERQSAAQFEVMALIVSGKSEAAYAALLAQDSSEEISLPYQAIEDALAEGKGKAVVDFLFYVLGKDPSLPLWGDLISLAAREGRSADALKLAKESVTDTKLEAAARESVLELLASAALADGAVDEAVPLMRERIALLKGQKPPKAGEALRVAVRLAELGRLLERAELRDEGIREAMAISLTPSDEISLDYDFLKLLVENGRAADAQTLLIQSLKPALARERGFSPVDFTDKLVNLAGLYDQAERPNDVLKLLTEAPWWGAKDLSQIASRKDFRGVTLGQMAARAFLANNDKAKAIESLKETLRAAPADDRSYQMLIDLEGQNALAFLGAQFADDRFQERPLIWKALLQLQAGQTAEADKTIREAIAIDPSDGEMGKNDRMRAYAVLADVLEKTGKVADAKIYRGAVEAVRLSEQADDFHSAGLLSQAIAMYRKALTYFADAYCIQSRLAVQLADLGDLKQAEEHYKRAYELMPDSFGRMESHCFGCERAFKGELAESLAERTFRKMIEENPRKPQLYYLMGYLRAEQGKPEEALPYYQKAVELDPDYINAWQKLLSLNGEVLLPNALRNEAVFAILRLQSSAASRDLSEVTDLRKLWNVVEQLRRDHPSKEPRSLLPLDATTAAIEKQISQRPEMGSYFQAHLEAQNRRNTTGTPGAVVGSQEVIQAISMLLNQFKQYQR